MSQTIERPQVKVKRAYDAAAKSDGYRILVDRIWPRGVTRAALRLDDWVKDAAPSTELRKWFNHDPAKCQAFEERYFRELDERPETVMALLGKARTGTLTLVFGAKDTHHNNAVALKTYLDRRLSK